MKWLSRLSRLFGKSESEEVDDNEPPERFHCIRFMTEKGEQRFPSFKTMPAYTPSLTSVLAPDVTLADDVSIEPIRNVLPGATYKIYVQNFPKGSKVEVRLLQGLKVRALLRSLLPYLP